MKTFVYSVLFAASFVLIYLVLIFIYRRRINTKVRLNDIEEMTFESESSIENNSSDIIAKQENKKIDIPFLSGYFNKISATLVQAHLLIKPAEFLMISLISAGLVFLICLLLLKNSLLALIFALLGFQLPRLQISRARDKRAKQLNNQLPEFLNVLSNALRAGLSINQAIDSASLEMSDPIKWEFQKVMRDNNLGRPLEDALTDMVVRTKDDDIEMFVSAINIQRQVGGNLAEVLEMIAETIRARVRLKGEIRTMTAQSKMSAVIIGILPIAIGFAIAAINPGYLSPLFSESIGQFMLVMIGIMMITGAYLLNKISTLEV